MVSWSACISLKRMLNKSADALKSQIVITVMSMVISHLCRRFNAGLIHTRGNANGPAHKTAMATAGGFRNQGVFFVSSGMGGGALLRLG